MADLGGWCAGLNREATTALLLPAHDIVLWRVCRRWGRLRGQVVSKEKITCERARHQSGEDQEGHSCKDEVERQKKYERNEPVKRFHRVGYGIQEAVPHPATKTAYAIHYVPGGVPAWVAANGWPQCGQAVGPAFTLFPQAGHLRRLARTRSQTINANGARRMRIITSSSGPMPRSLYAEAHGG
jgi:hypothetical protein